MNAAFAAWVFTSMITGVDTDWVKVGFFIDRLTCETYRVGFEQRHARAGIPMQTQPCQRVWSDQSEEKG